MRIYTRGGDSGETSIGSGERVAKDHAVVALTGLVDELNCQLGVALAWLDPPSAQSARKAGELLGQLRQVQIDLFWLGGELTGFSGRFRKLEASDVTALETLMDGWEQELPELRAFILPGGVPAAAQLHLARSACRRLEREMVRITREEPAVDSVTTVPLAWVNRLSDLLFVAARAANHLSGSGDIPLPDLK